MPINLIPAEQRDPSEPSDRLTAMMLELDSALHDRRSPELSEEALRKLSSEEQRQLAEFQQQLDSVYEELSSTTPRRSLLAKTTAFGETIESGNTDTDEIEIQINSLASWGIPSNQFGRFKILYALGMGGHGVVFLAHDPQLDRLVALKVPRPEVIVQASMRKRFVAEGRAAAMLTHPNIVSVFESGEVGSICYLVQDYIDGPSLAQWLQDRAEPVAPRVAAELVLRISEAVALAHSRQILHRDIKPGNILLDPLPGLAFPVSLECFEPKLADFGIAKLLQERNQTQTGSILGTAAYMAPEQAAGHRHLVGERADIYGLGAILYEMLTHSALFRGENELETLQLVINSEPPAPRSIVPDIPRDLEAICLKCLEKDPQQRYATAGDLAEDLRRFLAGKNVAARKYSILQRISRFARRPQNRSRFVAAMLALCVLGLGLASWLAWHQGTEAVAERSRSRKHQQQLAEDRVRRYPFDLRLAMQLLTEPAAGGTDRPNVAGQARTLLKRHIPSAGEPDQRGFEWHYLWNLLNPTETAPPLRALHQIQAHQRDAYYVTFSPDGTRVATSSQDLTARVFHVESGQKLFTLFGHQADVNCVEFSPDGKWLATASDDGTVVLWNAETGEPARELWRHTERIVGVSFHPSNQQVAACSHDSLVRVWDLTRPDDVFRELRHDSGSRIEAMTFSPDGRYLATVGNFDGLRLWDVARSYELHPATGRFRLSGEAVSFSHDGRLVAIPALGYIRVLSTETGQILGIVHVPNQRIRSLRFHRNSRLIVVVGEPSLMGVCDWPTGDFWTPFGSQEKSWCVACSHDGEALATSHFDGRLQLWDASPFNQEIGHSLKIAGGADLQQIAISPDGRRLAIARRMSLEQSRTREVRVTIRDLSTLSEQNTILGELPEESSECSGIAWSPDGQEIAVGWHRELDHWAGSTPVEHRSGVLCLDALTGKLKKSLLESVFLPAQKLDYTPEGNYLVTLHGVGGYNGRELRVYERETGEKLQVLKTHQKIPFHHPIPWAFSPQGDILATTATNEIGKIDVLQIPSLTKIAELPGGRESNLTALRFRPDGRNFWGYFGGNNYGSIDSSTGKSSPRLSAQGIHATGGVFDVAFSPDGRTAALATSTSIALVQLSSGEVLYQLPLTQRIRACHVLQFSESGTDLAAILEPEDVPLIIRVWRVNGAE